jgi:hypothetical protein
MGYRGDDARERAAWGAQSPRGTSREHAGYDSTGGADYHGAGYEGPDYDSPDYDAYSDGDGYGTPRHDGGSSGTGGFSTGGYGSGGYSTQGYESTASYDSDGYGRGTGHDTGGHSTGSYSTGGYSTRDSGGFPAGDYRSDEHGSAGRGGELAPYDSGAFRSPQYDSSYDSSSYDSDSYGGSSRGTSSSASGGYPTIGHSSGGYPTTGSGGFPATGSGGYPTAGRSSGGYPALGSGGYPTIGHPSGGYPSLDSDSYDAGNDWYGRSGPQPTGFADTSAQLAVRDPVRGYPPEPARADGGSGYTGQRPRYDDSERVTYPGYGGVEDDYGQDSRRGYDYDDYADYGSAAGGQGDQRRPGHQEFETRLDQVAIDYDAIDIGARRGYGQALQGDGFDGGRYQDGPKPPRPNGPRSKGAGSNRAGSNRAGKSGRPRRRALVYSAVVGVLIIAGGAAGYKYMYAKSAQSSAAAKEVNQPLPTSTGAAATQACAPQLGQFCHIESRALDPAPLTLGELYLPAFHSQQANADFLLQAQKADTDCVNSNALFGTDLISQVTSGKCTQVLRATYMSGDQTIMGTIGVVNLTDTTSAHHAGKVVGANDFVQPLTTSKGLTAKIGQGTGVVEAQYKGHYLILTWAEFTNLKTPTTAQTQALENWENALVAGTANIYLSQRMVDGDTPATIPSGSPTAAGSTSPSASASATG